jgi:succinoglycan biosynthesis protein ExoM
VTDSARITVAVCTFRRPDQLRALLSTLVTIDTPAGDSVDVVVVDNDPAESARSIVESSGHPTVRYVTEPRPGIAAARNAALRAADSATFVAFLDDDEEPARDWLVRLVECARRYDADAVAGPTYSRFAVPPPRWMTRGGFFDRQELGTGTAVSAAAAGNLLLRMASLDRLESWFDDRFGLTGGEDTELTARLVRTGGRLVWCDEASTYETVPAERVRAGWVFRRAYRSGNTAGRVELMSSDSVLSRPRVVAAGLVRVLVAVPELLVSLVVPRRHWSRALRRGLRGAGMTASGLGRVLTEYRRD